MSDARHFDVLVVGAGPAGLAAALSAASIGAQVAILDENPVPGGQIYRAYKAKPQSSVAQQIDTLRNRGVTFFNATTVVDVPGSNSLRASGPNGLGTLTFQALVLAVGARELFLPFPGWTLPNVMGVGGLQALVKSGREISGKRVVVAGTGPLLLTVGAYLKEKGAKVVQIAEQADRARMLSFLGTLLNHPAKLTQGFGLMTQIGTRLKHGTWVERAEGASALTAVQLSGSQGSIPCDYLACAFGFVPNIELPMLLGCEISNACVKVNALQETSVAGIYCAGEPTGIGGVEKSRVEGTIAGFAAVGRPEEARKYFGEREKMVAFGRQLDRTFALRPELRGLATPETIICRCEDVTCESLGGWESSRSAKLHTRCGMGPCQGRICGPATQFLFGWEHGSVRSPLVPVPLSGFELEDQSATHQTNIEA